MSDAARWPALVLTAGLATRLRPLSAVRAKAAMPVAGQPIIERILRWVRAAGIKRVVLNLHHRPDSITSLVGDGSQWDVDVRYSWEPVVLGSAGGPRRALPLLDADRFFIINGDTLTDVDLGAVARWHDEHRARVTMAVVAGDVQRYGGVLIAGEGRVIGFGRPRPGTRALHFVGVQVVEADVFASLADDRPAETVRQLYPQLIAEQPGSVVAYESDAEFLDVGTARDYLATVATVAAREGRGFDVGAGCRLAPGAVVRDTILWDRVTVEAGASVTNCILSDDVIVPAGAAFDGRVLVRGPDGLHAAPL